MKICRGSLVNAMGCMFHIGGVSFQDEIILSSSDKIYEYEEQTDDWKPVGNLTLPRHLCATVASGEHHFYWLCKYTRYSMTTSHFCYRLKYLRHRWIFYVYLDIIM